MKNSIHLMLKQAFSIETEDDVKECLMLINLIEKELNTYYLDIENPDYRLLNLLINLRYYVESWIEERYFREWSKSLITAIGKTFAKTAEYDFEIRYNLEAVKKRNQEKLDLCNKLKNQEKYPAEENSDKLYDITIFMVTYNQLELTKICLESVFAHTDDVSHEIFLIDNGSSDGSYEYFKRDSRLKVIRLVKNVGLLLALHIFYESMLDNGKFWMYMNNDVIVTPRWASQMLKCIKSDPKIGMVVPSTNQTAPSLVSDVPIGVYEYNKVQGFGESYNQTDPKLWVDLVMAYPFVGMVRPEIKRRFGYYEDGFYYKFYYADGDYAVSLIKSGYRIIQCRDTYVHHFEGGSNVLKKRRKMHDIAEYDFFKKFNFFPTDLEKAVPYANFDFNNTIPRDILFLEFSRGNVIGMVKAAHKVVNNTKSRYYSADTMERFNCEPLWEDVPFEKMQSWYDIEKIFPGVKFDLIIYLGNVSIMRDPLRFLTGAESRLKSNGKIVFYLENSATLAALNLCSSRNSARDACRLRKMALISLDEQLKIVRQAGFTVDAVVSFNSHEKYFQLSDNLIDKYRLLLNSNRHLERFMSNIRFGVYIITAKKQNLSEFNITMEEVLQKRKLLT